MMTGDKIDWREVACRQIIKGFSILLWEFGLYPLGIRRNKSFKAKYHGQIYIGRTVGNDLHWSKTPSRVS